ncbi:MAG: ATP-grasp domain-containing protein [Methylococcales bacterium]
MVRNKKASKVGNFISSGHLNGRFLLIAQPDSYRIAPYLKAAKQMGLDVLIASRGKHSLISEVYDGLHVDLNDIDRSLAQIRQEAQKKPFAGILGSDDSTVELAAKAAYELGLPHNPPDAARISCRKDLARAHLSRAGCPVPFFALIDLEQPLDKQAQGLSWPCVIKPLKMSASRGVIRANNINEFTAACQRIKAIIAASKDTFEKSHVLVEEYIHGAEVAFEGFLDNGRLTSLALFDKPDPLEGPFFEETIYVTPSLLDSETRAKIQQRVAQACTGYGLKTGPIHAELRINEQDAWILEVASRTIGGDCARVLDNGSDFNLEQLTIALAMGESVKNQSPRDARGVMMIPVKKGGILRRVEGLADARNTPNIEKIEIVIREGHELIPSPEGNQYPGYIFARGDSANDVTAALRLAYSKLEFIVAPVFKMRQM